MNKIILRAEDFDGYLTDKEHNMEYVLDLAYIVSRLG